MKENPNRDGTSYHYSWFLKQRNYKTPKYFPKHIFFVDLATYANKNKNILKFSLFKYLFYKLTTSKEFFNDHIVSISVFFFFQYKKIIY